MLMLTVLGVISVLACLCFFLSECCV